MSCAELVEHVTDFIEGVMAPQERASVDEHLSDCEGCTAYLEQIRTTIRLTGMLTEDQVSARARTALLEAFRDVHSA